MTVLPDEMISNTADGQAGDLGRYETEAPHTAAELQAVLAINRVLVGKLEHQRLLAAAMHEVSRIVKAAGSSILLIDQDTQAMTFHVVEGPAAETARTIQLPPGAGICGHVARTGEALIINDAQNDPRLYRPVDQATKVTTRNLLCVPLRSGQKLWGVLELINKEGDEGFTTQDLRVAETVAGQIALAFENSRLHGRIVRSERMAAVGQTVSGLAHCIKNILNGIRSGSTVVDRAMASGDADKVSEGWQVVRRNNNMLGSLVLDMLSLARDSKIHLFPTDVNDLADQVCQLMGERAGERGISIVCDTEPRLKETMADPTHLYRCLLNVVTNAIDACDDGGHVHVRVHRGGGRQRYTVSITDDGQGIAPEHRAKLFTEFFTTKGGRGTGLGLPVTRKLVTAMGGSVVFHSVPGHGTRFVFTLPVGEVPDKQEST